MKRRDKKKLERYVKQLRKVLGKKVKFSYHGKQMKGVIIGTSSQFNGSWHIAAIVNGVVHTYDVHDDYVKDCETDTWLPWVP